MALETVKLELPRGDYTLVNFTLKLNGTNYILGNGEDLIVTFADKVNSTTGVIQKSFLQNEITYSNGVYSFEFLKSDTINLKVNTVYQGDTTLVQTGNKSTTLFYLNLTIQPNLSNKVVV